MTHSSFASSELPSFFSQEELKQLVADRIPKHVAIIMDGNRRWAKKRSLPPNAGHWRGAETLSHIVRAAEQLGIKALTVYAFSTENWMRPKHEVDELLHLIKIYLMKEQKGMLKEGVRLSTIGDLTPFPDDLKEEIERTKEMTKYGSAIDFILALNYGAKDEIRRAVQEIVRDCMKGALDPQQLHVETISAYLDTAKWCDPELLIRTSGESRLSNFLLWQSSYTEMVVLDVLWPDFTAHDLLQAVVEYQNREQRHGL